MRDTIGKAGRYLLSGGAAAVVDLSAFAALLHLGLVIPVAASLSFGLGTICNYWLSSRHVFGAARSMPGYLRFLAFATLGMALNVGLTTLFVATTPLPPLAAKTISIAAAFVFNFTLNLLVVFRPPGSPSE